MPRGLFTERSFEACCCSPAALDCCQDHPLPPTLCLALGGGTCPYPFLEFERPVLDLCLQFMSFQFGPFSPFSGWFGRMATVGRGGGADDCTLAWLDFFLICWDFGGSIGKEFALVAVGTDEQTGPPRIGTGLGMLNPLRATSHRCDPAQLIFDFQLQYSHLPGETLGSFYISEIDGGSPASPLSACTVRAVVSACGCEAGLSGLLEPDLLLINPACSNGGPFDGGDTPGPSPPNVPADQVLVPCCSVEGVTIPKQITVAITSVPAGAACNGCLDVIVGATYQNALGAWVASIFACNQFITAYIYCVPLFNEFGLLMVCGANFQFGTPSQATGQNCNPLDLTWGVNIPADAGNPCCPTGGVLLIRAFHAAP